MIREWIRKWLGLTKGKILLVYKNGVIQQAYVPRECQIDLTKANIPGSIISYSGEYGPVEIEHLS